MGAGGQLRTCCWPLLWQRIFWLSVELVQPGEEPVPVDTPPPVSVVG